MDEFLEALYGGKSGSIPNISIKNPAYNPTLFTGATFSGFRNPVEAPEYSKYANTMNTHYGTMDKLTEASNELNKAFASITSAMHTSESQWFNDTFKTGIVNELSKLSEQGNYHAAIRYAKEAATKMASDSRIINRVAANGQYETARTKIIDRYNKGEITRDQLEAWEHANKYYYNEPDAANDSNNSSLKAEDWQEQWSVDNSINLFKVLHDFFGQISPEKGSDSNTVAKGIPTVNADGTRTTTTQAVQSGRNWEYKSDTMFRDALKNYINNNEEIKNFVIQQAETYKILIDKYTKELQELESKYPDVASMSYEDSIKYIHITNKLSKTKETAQNWSTNGNGIITGNIYDIIYKNYKHIIDKALPYSWEFTTDANTDKATITGKSSRGGKGGGGVDLTGTGTGKQMER